MLRKILICLMAISMLLLFIPGCSKQADETLRKVEVTEVTRSVFYAPQYIAASMGFFAEEGLEVNITNAGGSDRAMTALLAGQADIGLMGPETGVYVVMEGKEDHPIIVGQVTKRDGSFMIGREEEPDFSWANLKGKTIIGGRRGGMPFMTLQYLLEENGLTPGVDVEVLDNIQFDLIGPAFDGGIGDYVSLFEPNATLLVMEGKGYIVANVGQDSGEVPYTGYSVRPQTLKDDPAFVESFLRAIYRAQQWIITASNEEVAEAMMPFFPDANLEVLTSVAKNYRETDSWKTDPILQEEDYNRLLEIMDNAGELRGEAPYEELVDNTIARKVVGE